MPGTAIDDTIASAAIIRAAGLKVTSQRIAVLDALRNSPHASADQVLTVAEVRHPGTSAQAVYGILAAFTAAGLVRRISSAGSSARYETRVGDNHHHLVCVGCGAIQDVDCVVGEAPCLQPSDASGFTILSAEVTFSGLCAACGLRASSSPVDSPESSTTDPHSTTTKGSR